MLFSPTIGRRQRRGHLVPVGALPGLPNDQRNRLADPRSSSRRGGYEPHSRAVLPVMPAECSVRRARASVAKEHRRRNARRASVASAWGVERAAGSRLPRPENETGPVILRPRPPFQSTWIGWTGVQSRAECKRGGTRRPLPTFAPR